jgi:hypothetical protein
MLDTTCTVDFLRMLYNVRMTDLFIFLQVKNKP